MTYKEEPVTMGPTLNGKVRSRGIRGEKSGHAEKTRHSPEKQQETVDGF